MSLVSTYALADDGKWYNDPTLGELGVDYFICFDDDDPIELVIAEHTGLEPVDIFSRLELDAKVTSRKPQYSSRVFDNNFRFEDARSWWIEINKPIPAKFIKEHDGITTDMPFQGVLYDFGQGMEGLKNA